MVHTVRNWVNAVRNGSVYVNDLAHALTDSYRKIIDKHMPLKQSIPKDYCEKVDKPYITSGIKVSIAKKFHLHDKYKKSKLESDNLKYKTHI